MKIQRRYLLSRITSTGVGGPAKFYVEVHNEAELVQAVAWADRNRQKFFLIGDGTNLIPSDKGFNGLIIRNKIKHFQICSRQETSLSAKTYVGRKFPAGKGKIKVFLGAGNNLFSSIRLLNRLGLAGMEKMAGIPGTVGGAIYGCAGAYGQEIKDCLVRVRVFDIKKFVCRTLTKKQSAFNYRESIFKKHPDWIILGAELKLTQKNPKILKKTSAEIIKIREKKYPPHLKCPGSFFKNIIIDKIKPPPLKQKFLTKIDMGKINHGKLPAAHLLEIIGAKGIRQGGIAVAKYHANLIYNTGNGKTRSIKSLAEILKNRVKKFFGVQLEEEIIYI